MSNNKIRLHRVLTASPEKVFKAFIVPEAMAAWSPPYGFIAKVECWEARVGGKYKMSFINFSTDSCHSFGGEFLEIIPQKLLKYSDEFEDSNLPGKIITTVELNKLNSGTELIIIQEGIPQEIPTEMCYFGWQESLEKLKSLVEKDISDQQNATK